MLLAPNQKSNTSNESKEFKTVPPGSHLVRFYKYVDCGTHIDEGTKIRENKIKYVHKIMFHFEVFGEDAQGQPLATDDGKPLTLVKYLNLTTHEKGTLAKILKSWLNVDISTEPVEVESLLGKFGLATVTNYIDKSGKTKAGIETISPVPNIYLKAGLPEGHNPIDFFDFERFDSEKFNAMSEFMQKWLSQSPEYRKVTGQKADKPAEEFYNDDVPF
jgi:hypothetical protein